MRWWGARGARNDGEPAAARDRRRPDVEGLRGIAIILVVLYHSGLPVVGGYVGVDVFFVISGFLITGLLVREVERTGSVDLLAFYARRVRRLVPAAAVALTATMAWSAVALSPLDQPAAMADARAAALSAANLTFALQGFGYFDLDRLPSPVLHYWSLSVEEQFYLVWPTLLIALAWAARRAGRGSARSAGGIALALIAIGGLVASVVLTSAAPTWAFYMLPTRAWEFAVGGLIAIGVASAERLRRSIGAAIGCAAALVLVIGAVCLDGSVPYPGIAAAVPALAAAGLIVAGSRGALDGVLGVAPLQFMGRISYSLYLWHWPFIVLPAAMMGTAPDLATRLGLLCVAVVVAWLSRRYVETPFLQAGSRRPHLTRTSLQYGAAALALVVAVSGGMQGLADDAVARAGSDDSSPASAVVVGGAAQPAAPDEAGAAGDGRALDAEAGADAGPATDDSSWPAAASAAPSSTPARPSATPSASASPTPSATPAPPSAPSVPWTEIGNAALPAGVSLPKRVHPPLASARADEERLIRDGCFTWPDGTTPANCVYGNPHGKVTVVLIGDSHASHWFPALEVLASRNGWRLLPYVKASCPFLDVPVFHPFAQRRYTECEAWRARAIAAANAAKPDLVIVAEAFYAANGPIDPAARSLDAKGRAMAAAIARLRAKQVAIMVDNPRTNVDIPACLARYPRDVNRCAIPRSTAFPPNFGVVEGVAASVSGAKVIDVVASICPTTPCPVVRDAMILYRDGHHLTATFTASLAAPIGAALAPLLPGAAAPSTAPTAAPSPVAPAASSAAPTAAPAAAPSPSAGVAAPASTPSSPGELVREASVTATLDGPRGALEPVIATHPADPERLAVAYGRRQVDAGCGVAAISAGLALSDDGGRTWRQARRLPTDGTDRVPSYHSAVAWGPGPRAGTARLYWAGTTTLRCGGDLRVAVAWSDDDGRTWSRLEVMRATPPWVGGDPDITVDRNPASPLFGAVWLAYNYPLGGAAGSGIEVAASGDFGSSWTSRAVPRAPFPAGFPATWRFAPRIRTGPDGTAYVSWYQADMRRWDAGNVFSRGGAANVGALGFAVSSVRCRARCASLSLGPSVVAARLTVNAWTLGQAALPGAGSHGYADPMWSHGLDVDQQTGAVYLAVADVDRAAGVQARSTVLVGRSDDRANSWTWTRLPGVTLGGAAQSQARPGVVARGDTVVVGFMAIGARSSRSKTVMIGYGWAVSGDAGRSFAAPVVPASGRWPALNLDGQLNGPGTRDRLEWTADGKVVYAVGDGSAPDGAARAVAGSVRLAVIQAAPVPAACGASARQRL